MFTKTKSKISYPVDIEEVVYPDDYMDELEAEAEIASLQFKTGELQHISVEDLAKELGVEI